MNGLDWDRFERLPGDQAANFELLWRGAVRHTYGKYGTFRARAQQPGVEFHLELKADCSLGKAGQHFGWQTKWWQGLPPGRTIGAGRKSDVEDSLAKTRDHLSGLTDWVLCTHRPFAPADEEWWGGLATPFQLDHQVAEDLANLLVGDAELLRQTYFGELILSPDRLETLKDLAITEVQERWFPEVHQSGAAEMELRRILAEPAAWGHLRSVGSEIKDLAAVIRKEVLANPIPSPLQAELDKLLETAETIQGLLVEAHEHLAPGGDHSWRELGESTVPDAPSRRPLILRRLRAANHRAALACSNLIGHTRNAAALARSVFDELAIRCVAVTGDAGYGKTQLSARLVGSSEFRPAGVLLYGRQLRSRDDLDDLAHRVSINGKKVETFEALLAAVDAAGARDRCRLPIIIDGLNEAEDPNEWKPLLERAQVLLKDYPSVLLICTLRTSFVPLAIPPSLTRLVDLSGFGDDTALAVAKYFDHFKIDAGEVDLPLERFNHPIALRIFCSVTNPTREHLVQLDGRAQSLNAMFDAYLGEAAQRIETLTSSRVRSSDIRSALRALGVEMWESNAREVSEARVKVLFGDANRLWADSILNALQGEGILIRHTAPEHDKGRASVGSTVSGDSGTGLAVGVVYDLLAGHIIASAMVETEGATFAASLGTPAVTARFVGENDELHPLAQDIFEALVFVLPRHGLGHLWQQFQGRLFAAALLRTTELGAEDVDATTMRAWRDNLADLSQLKGFWPRLRSVRAVPNHPLNAAFTDALLRSLSVAQRDLTWTEWLRNSTQPYGSRAPGGGAPAMQDIRLWTARWQSTDKRTESDALRARWFAWELTSTVRDLRDAATAALYWYGRGNAASLFELALSALEINDLYIAERVIAAAYGVATAHQQPNADFAVHLGSYLEGLATATSGDAATKPTYHRLIRYYIAGTVEFARIHYPAALPIRIADGIAFVDGNLPDLLREGDERRNEVAHTIHMDFGNYTLGRLFSDRSNYDNKHEAHRNATDQILGITYDLGWRDEDFSSIDGTIAGQDRDRNPGRTERYGKKYSWIGLSLVSGMLNARGSSTHWLEVDIDPTFPQASAPLPIDLPSWARATPKGDRAWLLNGKVVVPDEFIYAARLRDIDGPWVLVHAELNTKNAQTGRSGYGLFNTVVVAQDDLEPLMSWWSKKEHPGRDLIDLPSAYYLFAGEIPWHPRMVTSGDDLADSGTVSVERGKANGQPAPHDDEDPYIDSIRVERPAQESAEPASSEQTSSPPDILSDAAEVAVFDYLDFLRGGAAAYRTETPPFENLEFESLAHSFAWEGHNSSENQTFAYVPSRRLSLHSGLTSAAASFNQVDPDGRIAAMSFSAPDGFSGHLLYVREDIIEAYSGSRAVVTLGWGERQIERSWPEDIPKPLLEVYRAHSNIWRTHRIM